MNAKWRDTFLTWSTLPEYKKRISEAQWIVDGGLRRYTRPYVAFSGGKDSTVMLHLVTQIRPNIMVMHWDYGQYYIPADYRSQIFDILRKLAINIRIETSEDYETKKRKAINVLGNKMFGELIPKLKKEGFDSTFVGLRREESAKRRRRIDTGMSWDLPEIWPCKNLTWMDIWAYIASNNLPYLSHYDKYSEVIGWDRSRLTTLFDPEFDKIGASNVDGVLNWRFKNQ